MIEETFRAYTSRERVDRGRTERRGNSRRRAPVPVDTAPGFQSSLPEGPRRRDAELGFDVDEVAAELAMTPPIPERLNAFQCGAAAWLERQRLKDQAEAIIGRDRSDKLRFFRGVWQEIAGGASADGDEWLLTLAQRFAGMCDEHEDNR